MSHIYSVSLMVSDNSIVEAFFIRFIIVFSLCFQELTSCFLTYTFKITVHILMLTATTILYLYTSHSTFHMLAAMNMSYCQWNVIAWHYILGACAHPCSCLFKIILLHMLHSLYYSDVAWLRIRETLLRMWYGKRKKERSLKYCTSLFHFILKISVKHLFIFRVRLRS